MSASAQMPWTYPPPHQLPLVEDAAPLAPIYPYTLELERGIIARIECLAPSKPLPRQGAEDRYKPGHMRGGKGRGVKRAASHSRDDDEDSDDELHSTSGEKDDDRHPRSSLVSHADFEQGSDQPKALPMLP